MATASSTDIAPGYPPAAVPSGSLPRLTGRDFARLSRFIFSEIGIKMPPTKKSMLESRLAKRLKALGMRSFSEYCSHLLDSGDGGEEVVTMLDLVTTNKTDFFREPTHYAYLATEVIPEWLGTAGRRGPLLAWSAGCSTGEEPYSLAMVLAEAGFLDGPDFRIVATDVCTDVLARTARGIYGGDRMTGVPPRLRRRYFLKSRDPSAALYRVVPELRTRLVLRRLNFMEPVYPLSDRIDVVFLRNVLIYFDRRIQQEILGKVCRHLRPGGYLFTGLSETLHGLALPLSQAAPAVYRKI